MIDIIAKCPWCDEWTLVLQHGYYKIPKRVEKLSDFTSPGALATILKKSIAGHLFCQACLKPFEIRACVFAEKPESAA